MSIIGGPLPGQERKEEEYPQDIGKETFQKAVKPITEAVGGFYEEHKETIDPIAGALGEAWEGAKRIDNKYDPTEYITSGVAHTVEKGALVYDKAIEGLSAVTGIYRGYFDVADALIPFTPSAIKAAKKISTLGKVKKVVKSVDKISDVSKAVKLADQIDQTRIESFAQKVATATSFGETPNITDTLARAGLVQYISPGSPTDTALQKIVSKASKVEFPSSRISPKTQIVDLRKWAEVFTNVRGTGSKMRDAASVLFQTLEDGSAITLNYKKMGRYFSSRTKDIKGAITNVHHLAFLEKLKHGLINHGSFELMEKAAKKGQIMASPIVKELNQMGIKLGNFDQNVVDLFSKLPDKFRTARVNDIYSRLGGAFTTDQIDALLGTTGSFWKELTEQQRKVLEGLRRTGDTEGIKNIWKELNLPDINKTKIPGKGYKLPNGDMWYPQTYEEFKNRFQIFAKKAGIKADIPDKFSDMVGKIDSKLEFFGGDHDLVHEIFTKLEKDVNSRIYKIDRIIKSPNFRTMDPKKVAGLIKEQVNIMETIAANVMEFRIKELDKLYTKLVKEGKYKPAIKDSKFTDLGEQAMQDFIGKFPNEAAVAGGLDLERHFSNINNALKKFDNPEMLKFMERAFGFAGQTLKSK